MSEFYQLRFATILAKTEPNASSELTALFASSPGGMASATE
jgi:hypothetical protein